MTTNLHFYIRSNLKVISSCLLYRCRIFSCLLNPLRKYLNLTSFFMNSNSVYKLLVTLDECGRNTWATSIKLLLQRYGFYIVWIEQGVGNEELFIEILEQRLKD